MDRDGVFQQHPKSERLWGNCHRLCAANSQPDRGSHASAQARWVTNQHDFFVSIMVFFFFTRMFQPSVRVEPGKSVATYLLRGPSSDPLEWSKGSFGWSNKVSLENISFQVGWSFKQVSVSSGTTEFYSNYFYLPLFGLRRIRGVVRASHDQRQRPQGQAAAGTAVL